MVEPTICVEGYYQCDVRLPRVNGRRVDIKCLPDTGAQLTVTGIGFIHLLGVKKSELIPLSHGVNAANNAGLGLLGGAFVTFRGKDQTGLTRAFL